MQLSISRGAGVLLLLCTGLVTFPAQAETWLMDGGAFRAVSGENHDKYVLAVSEIKRLVNNGDCDAVQKALVKLKKDFPQAAGPDLEAFIEAEILFCRGKLADAGKSYDKFLSDYPDSVFYEVALDREFTLATGFLRGQKRRVLGILNLSAYDDGVKMMDKIGERSGNAPIAVRAALSVARSYENRGKFEEAYYQWSLISSQWPTGDIGRDSLLGMARCKHASYKGPRFDSSDLVSAKSYYENFRLRYPQESEKLEINKIVQEIDEELAWKEYSIGQFYEKAYSKECANYYYQMVVERWPQSTAASEVQKLTQVKEPVEKEKK